MTSTLTNHRVTEGRLTVTVGEAIQLKLLRVPSYFKATDQLCGEINQIIAELTMKLMTRWHYNDTIVNLTFDTTSSNTGYLTAAGQAVIVILVKFVYLKCSQI